jgi:hypothetical protein
MSMVERLERPNTGQEAMDFWIDEAIWGHRLHDEQSPWLTVLECLGVAYSEFGKGRAFEEPATRRLTYTPMQQLRLRNILFNSPKLQLIAMRYSNSDEAWKVWREEMSRSCGGISDPDFTYLAKHFHSFRDFVTIVQFLRASSVEGANNKRWSSQFVFPFGPEALYEDLNVKPGGGSSNDRRFFARSGELLYLMLCRSGRGSEIRKAIESRFFDRTRPYARLIGVLQGPDELSKSERPGAYLPYASLPDYADLAADWIALLSRSLPSYDVLPHLVTITGLHLSLYFLRRAHQECGEASPLSLVCEIVAPVRTKVRDLSCDSYAHNNQLPQRALESYVQKTVQTEGWGKALASADPSMNAREVLTKRFMWPGDEEDLDLPKDPLELLEELKKRALVRHFGHVAKIHGTWGRAIGLCSRRSSRATRYAPTDGLLKSLVICCVDGRMELKEFTELLHTKYCLVLGDQQAHANPETAAVDPETFSDNLARLEERLMSLGLLRRLSDQCAYVENPFVSRGGVQ